MTDFESEARAILLQVLHDVNMLNADDGTLEDFCERMNANADDITALLNKHRMKSPEDPKPKAAD
jgi:hypothetical protein